MIPVATTTVTVLRVAPADEYAEPYSGAEPGNRVTVARKVRAVIGRGTGREQLGGGEQSILDVDLACDPIDLRPTDLVRDDYDNTLYRVVWAHTYPREVTEGGLRNVAGDV